MKINLTKNETEVMIWSMWQDYITNDFTFTAPQTKIVNKLLATLEYAGRELIERIESEYEIDKDRNFNRFRK